MGVKSPGSTKFSPSLPLLYPLFETADKHGTIGGLCEGFHHEVKFFNASCSFFSYPPEEIIYRSYNERCAWEQLKNTQLQSIVNSIQEKCIRHNISFAQSMPEVKKPLKPARVDSGPSRLERLDQFLSFVYDSHKVPENEAGSASTAIERETALNNLENGGSKQLNSARGRYESGVVKKLTFNIAE